MATSEAQVKATLKYKARAYKRIPLDVKIEEYEALKEYTDSMQIMRSYENVKILF